MGKTGWMLWDIEKEVWNGGSINQSKSQELSTVDVKRKQTARRLVEHSFWNWIPLDKLNLSSTLGYFNSSIGVNTIITKLPVHLQEKWIISDSNIVIYYYYYLL